MDDILKGIGWVIGLIIVGTAIAFIAAVFTTPPPIPHIADACYYSFNRDQMQQITLDVYNLAETYGTVEVCFFSKDFILFSEPQDNFKTCIGVPRTLPPQSSGKHIYPRITMGLNSSVFDAGTTAIYAISLECSYDVWGIWSKFCASETWNCPYKKVGDSYIRF